MSKKIYTALGPNVFVKEIKQENKVGELYIPDSIDLDFTYGEVISVSDGYFHQGYFTPATVVIGDKVCFPKTAGTKITLNGMKLIRVFASDIMAKEIEGEIENIEG